MVSHMSDELLCLENKRTVGTFVTSYLLYSLRCDLLCFQNKRSQRRWNLMWFGKQHPNKKCEPGGGRSLAGGGRRVKRGREGGDKTRAIRWSADMKGELLSGCLEL